jgi:effector-binding domain-containing protein
MAIKAVLREELTHSIRMKRGFERALKKLPKGSLVKRSIKGGNYYYLVYREQGRFRSIYKGTSVPAATIQRYQRAKTLRAKYRKSISLVKRQIAYLQGILRGKEAI